MSAPPYVLTFDGKVFPAGLNQINGNFADIYSRFDDATISAIEWLANSFAPAYVDESTYTLEGDQTGLHAVGRMVRAHLTGGHVIEAIQSSNYSTETELTTVVLASAVLDDTLDGVELGILTPGADSALPADVVRTFGDQTLAGNKTFTGSLSVPAPTEDGHAAPKSYADALNAIIEIEHNPDGSHKYPLLGFITGLAHFRKDADEVTVIGGALEINGVVYYLSALTDVQFTGLDPSAWIYIYVAAPAEGLSLSDSEFSADDTAPTRDHAKGGAWYNTAGDKRCIGFFLTDSSSEIVNAYVKSGRWVPAGFLTTLTLSGANSTPTQIPAGLPALGRVLAEYSGIVEAASGDYAWLFLGNGDDSTLNDQNDVLAGIRTGGATSCYARGGSLNRLSDAAGKLYYKTSSNISGAVIVLRTIAIPSGMAG